MLFNSLEFLVFFPLVTLLYFLFPHRFRWVVLLLASCIFYGAFIPSYLLILFLLIGIDYSAGILIEQSNQKKLWLVISILANMLLLGIFKYYNFFIDNVNTLTGADLIRLHWILPIGLSFHTFQSLSYTIEVYRGKQKAVTHFGYYALYVMFYPQLVAGPIERPQNIFPQLFTAQKFSSQKLYEGLRLMAWGFFKKLVIADRLGIYADAVFNNPQGANIYAAILAVIFFSIQIYADFSGYSDIAIGSARCMGIDLMINFKRPYFSTNIREFWSRWHISLSTWFRDYIYIPLGGNRKGPFRQKLNILITFILSGFWHGASWTFLAWGLLHGIYTIVYTGFKNICSKMRIPPFIGWLMTMLLVSFAWIFFRAKSFSAIAALANAATRSSAIDFNVPGILFGNFSIAISCCFILFMFFTEKFTTPKLFNLNNKRTIDIGFLSLIILLIIFFGIFNSSSFIYFQF